MTLNKIPKKIHYCWFGGNPLPELAIKCIESWKKYCPDYEIIEWNESNYDVTKNLYMKQAYEEKKWGFVPDYARLDIIYNHGGIYLDTDVEILRPLDKLLENSAFVGCENDRWVALGLGFGAEKGNPIIYEMLKQYDILSFFDDSGELNLTPAPVYQTALLKEQYGFKETKEIQKISDFMNIYPVEYFGSKDAYSGKINITNNTYSIHHYDGSWLSDKDKYSMDKRFILSKYMPTRLAGLLAEFVATIKFEGMGNAMKSLSEWFKKEKQRLNGR